MTKLWRSEVCFIFLALSDRAKLSHTLTQASIKALHCSLHLRVPCFKWLYGLCYVLECVRMCCVMPWQTNLAAGVWAIAALTEVWPAACPVFCSIISLLKWKQMEAVSVTQRGPQWIAQWSQVDRHRYARRCGSELESKLYTNPPFGLSLLYCIVPVVQSVTEC